MSYVENRDNLCTYCRREQQIGIVGERNYDVCRECLSDRLDREAAQWEDANDADREFRREMAER